MDTKEKLKKIKDYAQSLGICRQCFRHEATDGYLRCEKCRAISARSAAKRRKRPDCCNKCGAKMKPKERAVYKTCYKCRHNGKDKIYMREYYKKITKLKRKAKKN